MIEREDLKSVKFTIEKTFEKGIGQDLSYEGVKVDKTGKEIKDQLKERLVTLIVEKSHKFNELPVLAEKIIILPSSSLDEWELKGMRERISAIPYKYGYEQIYSDQNNPNKDMQHYNNVLNNYIELSVDCLLIKTIIDNIAENKKYQLNIQLASKMGF